MPHLNFHAKSNFIYFNEIRNYVKLSIFASIMKWSQSMLISWTQINHQLIFRGKIQIFFLVSR